MKKCLKTLVLCLLFSFANSAFANSPLLPGYILEKNGDSVACNIEFGDWHKNPELIRAEIKNVKKTFSPTDIKGFGVFGYGDYKAANITYHLNPINGTDLPDHFLDTTVTQDVFLKLLVNNFYSLYELELTYRKYYFIQKKDGPLSELLYRVANINYAIREDKQYANTISSFFLEEDMLEKYQQKIYDAPYNSTIQSLINILNEKHTGIKTKKDAPTVGAFQIALFAGGINTRFPTLISIGRFPKYPKLPSSTSVTGGITLLYVVPQRFQSLKFGFSLSYSHYVTKAIFTDSIVDKADLNNYKVTTYNEKLSLSNTVIMGSIFASYTFNPMAKIQIYAKAGISASVGKKNVYVTDDYSSTTLGMNSGNVINSSSEGTENLVQIGTLLVNPLLGAGLQLGPNRLEACYYFGGEASSNDGSSLFHIGFTSITYSFTILK